MVIKDEIINKYYSLKYPWFKDWYWSFPKGWFKAFGKYMLKDIDEILKRYDCVIKISDIKEKYGELRFYFFIDYDSSYWDTEYTDEEMSLLNDCSNLINDLVDKYSHISQNICMVCGKLDTPMLDIGGYVAPICRKCCERDGIYFGKNKDYLDCITSECQIPEYFTFIKYNGENKTIVKVDVSDIIRKIRKGVRLC